MSDKLRRGCMWSAALIASQALLLSAVAQEPDETRPRQSTTERGTATDMTRKTNAMAKTVTPQSFAKEAAVISKAEIELGQMAAQKSQDKAVRDFGQRMVKDHKAADAKLKKIAAQENLELPDALDAEHQAVKQKLSALEGEAFDREYAKEMAKGHDKAVALFEAASQSPQMPEELKEFAASTLPTLQEHDEMARSLHQKQE